MAAFRIVDSRLPSLPRLTLHSVPTKPPTLQPPWLKRNGQAERDRDERARKAKLDTQRASSHRRGYDKAWYRFRTRIVAERGCRCEQCGCLVTLRRHEIPGVPVAHLDHIVPIAERPDLRLEPTNVRVLCEPHHNARTARDQGFARQGRRLGCDEDGRPLDPAHPWSRDTDNG